MRIHVHDAFVSTQHPRGQPGNKGEFAKKSGGTTTTKAKSKPSGGEFNYENWLKGLVSEVDLPKAKAQVSTATKQIKHAVATKQPGVDVVVPKAVAKSLVAPTKEDAATKTKITNPAHNLNIQIMGTGSHRAQLQAALQHGNFPGADTVQNLTIYNINKPISTQGLAAKHLSGSAVGLTIPLDDETIIQVTDATGRKDLVSVMTHELGHAVDIKHNYALSTNMGRSIQSDAAKLTPQEQKKARYYTDNPKEGFAELYRLAFSPAKEGAFLMSQQRAQQVFAKSLAEMRRVTQSA
jgi:predicted Zn-dependent protease